MITIRIFSFGFLFMLTWTIGVHAITLFGGTFEHLRYLTLAGLLVSAVGVIKSKGLLELAEPLPQVSTVTDFSAIALRKRDWKEFSPGLIAIAAGALIAVGIALQYKLSMFTPLWLTLLASSAAAAGYYANRNNIVYAHGPESDSGAHVRMLDPAFAACAVLLLLLYFLISVSDTDDSLFLNFAVGAKQLRSSVLQYDTMLGIDGLSMIKSTYKLEGYHLLAAAISDAIGWPVRYVAYAVLPSLFCIWTSSVLTICHYVCNRESYRRSILFHVIVILCFGGALQSYGMHGVTRFFQGKGLFVTVLVPLTAVLTLLWLRTGRWGALALLGGAIIIGMGFTANAVYAAPLTSALIGAAWMVTADRHRWRSLALALVVLYPLSTVLYLFAHYPPGPSEITEAGTVGGTLWTIFGSPPTLVLGLMILAALAWSAALGRPFRMLSAYMAFVFLVILNPWTWEAYARYVTGYINYRLMWSVPFTFLVSIALSWVYARGPKPVRAALMMSLLLLLVAPGSMLRHASYGFSAVKVAQPEFGVAQRMAGTIPRNNLLLAPESVSAWVTTLEDHPAVVEGREIYIPQRTDARFKEELRSRALLFREWNDSAQPAPLDAGFYTRLNRLNVRAVLVDEHNARHGEARAALRALGFRNAWAMSHYALLVR